MTTSDTIELVRLIVEGIIGVTVGGILVWLVVSLKSTWAAQKDLMEQRIELLRVQMPSAQDLAARVQIIDDLAKKERLQFEEQIAQTEDQLEGKSEQVGKLMLENLAWSKFRQEDENRLAQILEMAEKAFGLKPWSLSTFVHNARIEAYRSTLRSYGETKPQ